MPLNAAIQRIQRLIGFNGVLTDGAGGNAQTYLSNGVGLVQLRKANKHAGRPCMQVGAG